LKFATTMPIRNSHRSKLFAVATTVCAAAIPALVPAQSEGGLYIAGGAGFTFQQAADQGLAQNPGGQRFFLLSLPPETQALTKTAQGPLAAVRDRVVAANGVLLVCKRDVDSGKVNAATLVPGVVAVRGFPPPGSKALPDGERYFPGENPANLPASNESLRRLRVTCSS
jgi:hypothetical protein